MTQPSEPSTNDNNNGKRSSRSVGILLILIVLFGSITAVMLWKNMRQSYDDLYASKTITAAQVDGDVLSKIDAHDKRINEIISRLAKLEQAPAVEEKSAPAPEKPSASERANSDEIALLKSEVVALTTTVVNLESRLKQTTSAANSSQRQALAALVNSLAALADTGRGFVHELDFLKQAVDSYYPDLKEPVAKLVPIAETGALNIPALKDKFAALAPKAENAVIKASATNWLDRLMAEVRGIVTIRSLHPKSDDASITASIIADLDQKKLDEALKKVNDMPDAAKEALKEWKKEAEARQTLDNVLGQISQYLSDQSEMTQ